MRIACALTVFVSIWFAAAWAAADIVKPENSPSPQAPPGYEPQPGAQGPVPFGPSCALQVPPGAIPEDLGSGAEDCVTDDFVDTTNAGCNSAVFLEPGDVMTLGVEGLGEQRQEVVGSK